jgi:hypothetical protein
MALTTLALSEFGSVARREDPRQRERSGAPARGPQG